MMGSGEEAVGWSSMGRALASASERDCGAAYVLRGVVGTF